ncbi:MAG: TOBE domain-containing protein, partial [Nocardioidaceae bacterium]
TFVGGVAALPATRLGSLVRCALGDLAAQDLEPGPSRTNGSGGHAVTALVRPEQIRLVVEGADLDPAEQGRAGADAHVEAVDYYGAYATVRLVLVDGTPLVARVAAEALPQPGERVRLAVIGPVGVSS